MKLSTVRRSTLAALAAVMAVASMVACSGGDDAAGNKVRYQTYATMIPYTELADALGYLDDVELEWVGEVSGGPAALQALVTDQIDIAGAPFNGATAKMASTGVPITAVVAGYGSSGEVTSSIATLEDSGITTGRDLIGKKVAVNTLGANAEAIISTYLRQEGLSPAEIKTVTLVPLPAINIENALRQGQVDAAYFGFSAKKVAFAHGGLRVLADDTDFVGPYNGGAFVLRNDYIDNNPETSRALVEGIARAIEFDQNHSNAEVLDIYGDYLTKKGRGDSIKGFDSWAGNGVATPGGVLRDEDFSIWVDWLTANGEIDSDSLAVPTLYSNEFNPFADGGDQQ